MRGVGIKMEGWVVVVVDTLGGKVRAWCFIINKLLLLCCTLNAVQWFNPIECNQTFTKVSENKKIINTKPNLHLGTSLVITYYN